MTARFVGGSAASIFWRRSLFRHSGLAHAFENRLELGEIRRVVAHRRPGGAEAGDGESRNEGETGLNRGTGLIEAAKLRESGAQHKIYTENFCSPRSTADTTRSP